MTADTSAHSLMVQFDWIVAYTVFIQMLNPIQTSLHGPLHTDSQMISHMIYKIFPIYIIFSAVSLGKSQVHTSVCSGKKGGWKPPQIIKSVGFST